MYKRQERNADRARHPKRALGASSLCRFDRLGKPCAPLCRSEQRGVNLRSQCRSGTMAAA